MTDERVLMNVFVIRIRDIFITISPFSYSLNLFMHSKRFFTARVNAV